MRARCVCMLLPLLVGALSLTGCPEAGLDPSDPGAGGSDDSRVATISVLADLSPAYDNGVAVDGASVTLVAPGLSLGFELTVDTDARAASGSKSDVPYGSYTATIEISAPRYSRSPRCCSSPHAVSRSPSEPVSMPSPSV